MATTTGLSAPDLRLATAIETAAYALTHETIEAAPGGEGNTAKLGLALYDVIAAVDAYAAAYMRLGTEPERVTHFCPECDRVSVFTEGKCDVCAAPRV